MGNHGQTEGGGALSLLAGRHLRWYALWTHSQCEQLVRGQLDGRGFEVFLPTIAVWSWRAGVKHRIVDPEASAFPRAIYELDKENNY
jgi:hypothetical protein